MKGLFSRARSGDSHARAWLITAAAICILIAIAGAVLFSPRQQSQAFGVGSVSAGGAHTCIIGPGLGVKCWGLNSNGELGIGSTNVVPNPTPLDVVGLSNHVDAVSSGRDHTCALTSTGGVKCWGANYNGQLGDGTTSDSPSPVNVSGLSSGVVAIAAGTWHTCALTSAGGVQCWGYNMFGQLGNGTTTVTGCLCITTPVNVTGLGSGVGSITAGEIHSCAVTTAGAASCWGNNDRGELGDGTTSDSNVPVGVSGLGSGVAVISGGVEFTCALLTSGAEQCWGWNDFGQLGNGATSVGGCQCIPIAATVSGLGSGVTEIAAGTYQSHTCAVAGGVVKCWGANGSGQVGNGTTSVSGCFCIPSPVNVSGITSGVSQLTTAFNHSCALLALSATLKCWGGNASGQLGDGGTSDSNVAVSVVASSKDDPPVPPCATPYVGGCVTHALSMSLTVSVPALSSLPLSCTITGVDQIGLGPVADGDSDLLNDVQVDLTSLSGYIDCPGPIGVGSSLPSGGEIEEVVNSNAGVMDFPATGTFSVCIRVQTTLLGILENCPDSMPIPTKEPIVLTCSFPTSFNDATCVVVGTSNFYDASTGAGMANVIEGSAAFVAPGTTPDPTPTPVTPGPPVGGIGFDAAGPGSPTGNDAMLWLLLASCLAGAGVLGSAWIALHYRRS